ncbi:MAG: hypothetical protein AAFQ38_18420, partial [Pseudomonadota bacterium]
PDHSRRNLTPLKQKFITLATSEGLDSAFEYFPNADIRAKCSIGQSGLIAAIGCGAASTRWQVQLATRTAHSKL